MFQTQITRCLLVPIVAITLGAMIAPGCHRGYYRRQADVEAKRLIREKAQDPRWSSSTGSIEIDQQSRMFDPFSLDHPPIPPDDPHSHELMKCVDGKQGYPHWHANGDTDYVSNPEWQSYLPLNEKGQLILDIDGAVQLAFLHSADLQEQKETLYLSALDVSLDRFGFDSQLFAGFNSFLTSQGRFRGGGDSSTTLSQSLGSNGQGFTLERLGITGANFAVGLANSILWNFSGPDTQTATTLIDFSLIQPLLRGAGRERIMEALTQSERTLLANVRQMDRFRRGFYLQVVTGRNPGAGPNRAGFFLGLPGAANNNAGGFMGLLLQQQFIKIQQFNVNQLEGELNRFREFFIRERVDSLQLRQFESTLLNAQQNLLNLKTNYQNALDQFKRTLGIPPDIEVVISDPTLDQFELISSDLTARQGSLTLLKDITGQMLIELGDLLPPDPEPEFDDNGDQLPVRELTAADFPEELNESIDSLKQYVERSLEILEEVAGSDLVQIEQDIEALTEARPRRVEYLRKLQQQIDSGAIESEVEAAILDPESIQEPAELKTQLSEVAVKIEGLNDAFKSLFDVVSNFETAREEIGENDGLKQYIRTEILETVPERLTELTNAVLELSLVQALARANAVEIPDVNLQSDVAFKIARCFRRDWMNARASLVDQWRQIEFVADQLEAQVDLVFEGDIGNDGDNPFKLRYETGQLRGGFRFDAPIVRLAERNQYRQTLINYQQSKRDFYQFEDEVNRNLRQILRNINLNKILYEVNRKSIQIRIEEVELARFRLEEPARPGATRSSLGATTANDLTRAINGLQNAQNAFLQTWVTYEVLRRSLDFDLGTMQVDPRGNWIDPGPIDPTIADRAASNMGITLQEQYCCELPGEIMEAASTLNYQSGDSQSREAQDASDAYYDRPDFEATPPDSEPRESQGRESEVPIESPARPEFEEEIEPIQAPSDVSRERSTNSYYQQSSHSLIVPLNEDDATLAPQSFVAPPPVDSPDTPAAPDHSVQRAFQLLESNQASMVKNTSLSRETNQAFPRLVLPTKSGMERFEMLNLPKVVPSVDAVSDLAGGPFTEPPRTSTDKPNFRPIPKMVPDSRRASRVNTTRRGANKSYFGPLDQLLPGKTNFHNP